MEEWNLIQENRLKAALSDLETHFAKYWAAAFEARQEGTIALVAPASYCIQLDGTRLVIDPIFRFPWQQEAVKDRWQRDLAAADGVLYTHSHGDHYRPEIARAAGITNGYRVISNCGPDAAQSVPHLHFHILGGKKLPEHVV